MPTLPSRSETLPTAARAVAGTCVRLLVRAVEAVTRAAATAERLRASGLTARLLPGPRRPYDEL